MIVLHIKPENSGRQLLDSSYNFFLVAIAKWIVYTKSLKNYLIKKIMIFLSR